MPTALCRALLLSIEGKDAVAFAQAQFTSDVGALAEGHWQWSAWLDAHGRARALFALLRVDAERLLAWQPLGDAVAVRDALRRYVFRSAVRLEAIDGWAVHRLDTAPPDAGRQVVASDGGYRLALPGARPRVAWIGSATGDADPAALAQWRRDDLAARLPLLAGELAGEFVPQALELERIDAIRFDKGCYPGQEIAARLHFRGGGTRARIGRARRRNRDRAHPVCRRRRRRDARPRARGRHRRRPRVGRHDRRRALAKPLRLNDFFTDCPARPRLTPR